MKLSFRILAIVIASLFVAPEAIAQRPSWQRGIYAKRARQARAARKASEDQRKAQAQLAAQAVAVPAPAIPQAIELPWGRIEFSNNEVTIVSTVDDPPGFRLASTSGSLGKVSFSFIDSEGKLREAVLVQGKKDERTRSRPDLTYGEFTVHMKGPERSPGDDGMVLVASFWHDYVWIKGISSTEYPQPPALVLPDKPQDPQPTCDTSARTIELEAINREFTPWGITIDGDAFVAYQTCRHSNLKEVHDDVVRRNDGNHDPSAHPVGAPY